LNVSRKGVSATFGVRGASINVGQSGTYINTGIPGTGIYSRKKIGINSTKTLMPNTSNINTNQSDATKGCLIGLAIVFVIAMFFVNTGTSKPSKVEESIQDQINLAQSVLNKAEDSTIKEILQNYISCAELSRKADETEAVIKALEMKMAKKSNSLLEEQLEKYKMELSDLQTELNSVQKKTFLYE
jgi:hypothetical protein